MATGQASAPSIADPAPQRGRERTLLAYFARARAGIEPLFEAERAQLPLWLPVGLMLGIAAWFLLPDPPRWAGFLLGSAALGAGLLAFGSGTRAGRAVAIFCLAACLGCALIWGKAEHAAAPRIEREQLFSGDAIIERVQPMAAEGVIRLVIRPTAPGLPP
ncbi:MAG TPA: competence protein ComEC, partial [Allosphingosinicella sp.]